MPSQAARNLIITIDGPAGSGKSTTARKVAERLGYCYLDSGALYRGVTWAVLQQGLDPHDETAVARLAETLDMVLRADADGLTLLLNGRDISREIRSTSVTEAIAPVAANPGVRQALLETQRRFGRNGGIVAEGRDMGTVVFPQADCKFYLVASLVERAKRRQAELAGQGVTLSLAELTAMIEQRDLRDSSRAHSPLRKPDQAIEIDTSKLTINQQVDLVVREVAKINKQDADTD